MGFLETTLAVASGVFLGYLVITTFNAKGLHSRLGQLACPLLRLIGHLAIILTVTVFMLWLFFEMASVEPTSNRAVVGFLLSHPIHLAATAYLLASYFYFSVRKFKGNHSPSVTGLLMLTILVSQMTVGLYAGSFLYGLAQEGFSDSLDSITQWIKGFWLISFAFITASKVPLSMLEHVDRNEKEAEEEAIELESELKEILDDQSYFPSGSEEWHECEASIKELKQQIRKGDG